MTFHTSCQMLCQIILKARYNVRSYVTSNACPCPRKNIQGSITQTARKLSDRMPPDQIACHVLSVVFAIGRRREYNNTCRFECQLVRMLKSMSGKNVVRVHARQSVRKKKKYQTECQ